MLISNETLPTSVWDLYEAVEWSEVFPSDTKAGPSQISKEVWTRPWIRSNEDGAKVFFIGTRTFGSGARVLLLDAPSITSIQRTLSSSAPVPPLPSHSNLFTNFTQCNIASRRALFSKLVHMKMRNFKRSKVIQRREGLLEDAKAAGSGGELVALSVRKVGKRRRVTELAWTRMSVDGDQLSTKHFEIPPRGFWKIKANIAAELLREGATPKSTLEDALALLISDLSEASVVVSNLNGHKLDDFLGSEGRFEGKEFEISRLFKAAIKNQNSPSSIEDMVNHFQIQPEEGEEDHPLDARIESRYIFDIFLSIVAIS